MEKFEKYLNYVITSLLILILFRSCGISSELKRQDKKINEVINKVHKVDSLSIEKNDMIKIIKETPNWKIPNREIPIKLVTVKALPDQKKRLSTKVNKLPNKTEP